MLKIAKRTFFDGIEGGMNKMMNQNRRKYEQ